MNPPEDDVVDRAFSALRSESHENPAHRVALEARLFRWVPASRRRPWRRAAIIAAGAFILGGAAVASFAGLNEWFRAEVLGIERDPSGEVTQMHFGLETGGSFTVAPDPNHRALFWEEPDENGPIETVALEGGGTIRLRLIRRSSGWQDEVFHGVVVGSEALAEKSEMVVTAYKLVSRVVRIADGVMEIRQHFANGHRIEIALRALPENSRRYSDGSMIVEHLDP